MDRHRRRGILRRAFDQTVGIDLSGQVGLRFLGKVVLGGRDRTAITSVEAECEKSRDQVDPVERANTGVFGAAPGNLRRAATDWWSNEDSNHGPGRSIDSGGAPAASTRLTKRASRSI
jgi:hypothetical protein